MESDDDERARPGSDGGEHPLTADELPNPTDVINRMNTPIAAENLMGPDRVMDVRPIPCAVKHGLIIRTWLEMPVGGHFTLLNDHDPVPLYYQFSAEWPGAFTWEHLAKGPEEFRVKITKLRPVSDPASLAAGSCRHS